MTDPIKLDKLAIKDAEIESLRKEVEALRAQVPKWIPVTERLPDDGVEVLGFHPDWIDDDFNPTGRRACFQNDGDRWHSARWYDHQDTYINGDERHFDDDPDGSLAPSHWQPFPPPPTKETEHE